MNGASELCHLLKVSYCAWIQYLERYFRGLVPSKQALKQDAGRSKRSTRRHGRVCCESEKIQGITIAIHCYYNYTTKMLQCFWLENFITLVTFTMLVRIVLSSATTGNPGISQHSHTKECFDAQFPVFLYPNIRNIYLFILLYHES